jgi:hypothetical protein
MTRGSAGFTFLAIQNGILRRALCGDNGAAQDRFQVWRGAFLRTRPQAGTHEGGGVNSYAISGGFKMMAHQTRNVCIVLAAVE